MARTRNISKSDDRIRLSGAIDELNSHIGLMISMISSQETVQFLESVQSTLNLVATGVEDPYNRKCRISEERVTALETEIDNLEKLCPRPVTEKLKETAVWQRKSILPEQWPEEQNVVWLR